MWRTAAAYSIQKWPEGGAAFYDWAVRRTLALLLLVGLTTLLTLDPLVCPDGCTTDHNSTRASDQLPSSSGDCLLCRSGLAPVAAIDTDLVITSTVIARVPEPRPILRPAPQLDHPPRHS